MDEKNLNLKWLNGNLARILFFPAISILLFYSTPSLVHAGPSRSQMLGEQFFGEPCNYHELKDEDGVPQKKCNTAHGLGCLYVTNTCGCDGYEHDGSWVDRKWDPTFEFEYKEDTKKPGFCIYGEMGPCYEDRKCIRGLECQNHGKCSKPATKLFGESCKYPPSVDYCMPNRDLKCTDKETGSYNFQCRCLSGKWNRHALVNNSKHHPNPISSYPGKCQIPENEKCGKEAVANFGGGLNLDQVPPCWNGTECKYQERFGMICVKKDEPKPKPTPAPKPTTKATPKAKTKFIDTPCKKDCDHVNGDLRFLFCHHDKCECLPSPKKGAQVPTGWDPLMEVPGLNETGQCVIKDTHDCKNHFLPYACRTKFICGEKGKCIPEPTFIDEPCKDTCDHVQGDERFLACHSGKCHCLPSTKFLDKDKKKIKQVLTEWDAKKQIQNMTYKGQCVIQEDQDCEGHIMPIECKTGFHCNNKGRCAKEPTFINEPCKDSCDHVEGDERFLTCHAAKCTCLPSTKFADKSKKKLVQVPTEWDPHKKVAKTKFKGQCVIKNGKDCTDHLMSYECRTGHICRSDAFDLCPVPCLGTCGHPEPEKVKFIKEPCKSSCDHINGGDRFLTCHNGECSCLPSMRYSDKEKKKIQKVPTEWDKAKPVDGLKDPGQCVIKSGSECENPVLPYTCKTGFNCGGKGTCEKNDGLSKKVKRMARYRNSIAML